MCTVDNSPCITSFMLSWWVEPLQSNIKNLQENIYGFTWSNSEILEFETTAPSRRDQTTSICLTVKLTKSKYSNKHQIARLRWYYRSSVKANASHECKRISHDCLRIWQHYFDWWWKTWYMKTKLSDRRKISGLIKYSLNCVFLPPSI